MKTKKLLFLPIVAALLITGCDKTNTSKTNPEVSSDTPTSSEIVNPSSSNTNNSRSVPAPIILGNDFEEAVKKDYKNMYV